MLAMHDYDLALDDAIAEAASALECERMRVWVPSSWDVDDETVALATEIAALRAEKCRLIGIIHDRDDRLPDLDVVYADLMDANRVRDHDGCAADARYLAWRNGGRRGKRPTHRLGGLLDGFACSTDRRKPCSPLEAFRWDLSGARTWRDVASVLPALAMAWGVDVLSLPDDVICRHVAQDEQRNAAEAAWER